MDWLKRIVLAFVMTFFAAVGIVMFGNAVVGVINLLSNSAVAAVVYGLLFLTILAFGDIDVKGGDDRSDTQD